MNSPDNNFSFWLKKNLIKNPSAELDKKILSLSHDFLNKTKKKGNVLNWKIPALSLFASCLLVIGVFLKSNSLTLTTSNKMVMNENPEMILNYNSIELMSESSSLSEQDWEKISENKNE
jgi:hypothetical protein